MTRLLLATALLLIAGASASWADAADGDIGYTLPGDGLFSMPPDDTWNHDVIAWWWLAGMVLASGTGLWVLQWIDDDARRLKIDPTGWNYAGLGLAGASLLSFFVLPPWLAVPAVLAGFLAIAWKYIPARNARALPTRRLFTPEHLASLRRRGMSVLGIRAAGFEKRLARLAKEHVPVALYDQSGRMVSSAETAFDPEAPLTEVKIIVGEAVRRHAREIQWVPGSGQVKLSYLIDGVVHEGPAIEGRRGAAVMLAVNRSLVDAASPAPQFRVQVPTLGRRSFTVRVHAHGEGDAGWLRMRLTGDDESMRKFPQLGMTPAQQALVQSTLDTARGLVVVASPAAMGSHTTVYAFLDSLDPFSRNIVTFERPVLGKLDSIDQRTFTDAKSLDEPLAEILRREVDLVMLSEIPDAAAAGMALSAATRDQTFIARLALPDAASVPGHLIRLGADPRAVAEGLHTIIAQRLVRRLCPACRQKVEPPAEILRKVGIDPSSVEFICEETTGCDQCGHTGFLGRAGIFEIWPLSAESRRLIAQNASPGELHAAALGDGAKSLQHAGFALVLEGVTSLRELARALKAV